MIHPELENVLLLTVTRELLANDGDVDALETARGVRSLFSRCGCR